jgi:pyruvate dehydrogenase E2 component (dihydrolipoamide acetyltransferase)
MPIEMKMPRLSDTMEVGTVVKWNVKPGQKVRSGDVVADIETDKATMELQSFDDGTVAALSVQEGQSVPVGTTIMVLAEAGESPEGLQGAAPDRPAAPAARPTAAAAPPATAPPPAGAAPAPAAAPPAPATPAAPAPPANGHDRIFASPLARKIAEEHRLDLAGIHGTGPSGRITRRDVEAAIGALGATGPRPATPAAAGLRQVAPQPAPEASRLAGLTAAPVPGTALPAPAAALAARTIPLSNMRATIARRLVQSKATIPHYQVTVSARMDALLALRAQLNDQLTGHGVKLSVNDFLVRACALAIHEHPFINSRWMDGAAALQSGALQTGALQPGAHPRTSAGPDTGPSIQLLPDINIGVAIALPVDPQALTGGGLVVATLRNADRLGLRQISAMTRALSDKARTRGLTIDEMADATFTISNLGMYGVDHFTAIINPPNTAILAVGAAAERPVVETNPATGEKRLAIGHEMAMTLSSDHRVIDGAMAAQFLATVREFLEKPATLLV